MSSYTITVTGEDRDLVVDALRAAARQRTTVARKAAGRVAADKRNGRDVRPAAVKVTGLLAEADVLEGLADQLATATPTVEHRPRPTLDDTPPDTPPTEDDTATETGDDGTSPEARHLAELAGLKPADPDAVEDPETGATPEDEPTDADLGELNL